VFLWGIKAGFQSLCSVGDFSAKVARENIFKQKTGNESLHQDSNDNGVRIVNLPIIN